MYVYSLYFSLLRESDLLFHVFVLSLLLLLRTYYYYYYYYYYYTYRSDHLNLV